MFKFEWKSTGLIAVLAVSLPALATFGARTIQERLESRRVRIDELLADARFVAAFLGLESTRKVCLEEVNKGSPAGPE